MHHIGAQIKSSSPSEDWRRVPETALSEDGDVRAFYAALGVPLPGWAQVNATVRCFASPEAHAHEDRTPSCSVSLQHGAWRCWACGARGGAYDAALARGHTPASAIDLLVAHGLTQRRPAGSQPRPPRATTAPASPPIVRSPVRRPLVVTDGDLARWQAALFSPQRQAWVSRLCSRRLWDTRAMRQLELGYDRGRLTIPIRAQAGALRGVLRYSPDGAAPKVIAVPGSRLGLIPHPGQEPSAQIVLVEGPPDMIAARSRGWPAIAVPGDHAWKLAWAELLHDREVIVLMDCDPPGRAAAARIAADLQPICQVRVVDLAPDRHDGFDLTDWLQATPQPRRASCTPSSSSKPTITR